LHLANQQIRLEPNFWFLNANTKLLIGTGLFNFFFFIFLFLESDKQQCVFFQHIAGHPKPRTVIGKQNRGYLH